jgi:hypothetical protein
MSVSIKKLLAVAVVIAALVPASASAMINRESPAGPAAVAVPSETVTAAPQSGGFRWGDAGIGAGAALVLVGMAGLGVVAWRRARRRGLVAS